MLLQLAWLHEYVKLKTSVSSARLRLFKATSPNFFSQGMACSIDIQPEFVPSVFCSDYTCDQLADLLASEKALDDLWRAQGVHFQLLFHSENMAPPFALRL